MLKKRERPLLHSSTDYVDYIGKSNKQGDNSQYLVGFYNKKKGIVRLVPVERTYGFSRLLKQADGGELIGLNQDAKGMEHKEIIVQQLGTKKSKKILNQMKNKVIDEGRIQSASEIKQLIKLQAGALKDDLDEEKAKEFEKEWARKKSFLPDFNLSAKTPLKIYSLKSIMPDEEAAEIQPDYIDDPKYLNQYIIDTYGLIEWEKLTQKVQDEKKKQLVYLNYLIKMRRLKKVEQNLEELSSYMGIPLIIVNSILSRFYEPSKGDTDSIRFVRPKPLDVKMICYIFILNLVILNFKVSLNSLMKVLMLDENK